MKPVALLCCLFLVACGGSTSSGFDYDIGPIVFCESPDGTLVNDFCAERCAPGWREIPLQEPLPELNCQNELGDCFWVNADQCALEWVEVPLCGGFSRCL